ncbi:MAG TPA: LPS export ABC transporter periplasmic protein LptC [Desulfobacterales bacterium]|nr:LPS export ABC transporter periplasmic protein LptC [Desulfobacterales bacterium]
MKRRNLLWQIPLLIFIALPLWRPYAADFLKVRLPKAAKNSRLSKTSFDMRGVLLVQSSGGQDNLWLRTSRLYSRENQRLIYLAKTEARLGTGKPVLVTSGSAVYDRLEGILTLMDNVVVKTPRHETLRTPVMRYLARFEKVKSAAPVEFDSQGLRIAGTSFMYDLRSGDFRVGSRVRCRLW